jgi:hypothetical protein
MQRSKINKTQQTKKLGSVSSQFVWIAILLSAASYIYIPLSQSDNRIAINLSLFDPMLALFSVGLLIRSYISTPPRWVTYLVVSLIFLIIGHTIWVYFAYADMALNWLLRDIVKFIAVIVIFYLCFIVFTSTYLRPLSKEVALISLALIVTGYLFVHISEVVSTPRTLFNASLWGVFILYLWAEQQEIGLVPSVLSVGLSLCLTLFSLILFSKISFIMGSGIFILLLWARFKPELPLMQRLYAMLPFLVVGLGLISLLIWYAITQTDILMRIDSLERSSSIRLILWQHAFHGLLETFPRGLGLGQFATTVHEVPILDREGQRFIHSTFFSLMSELGVLGFGLVIGLLILLYKASLGFSGIISWVFLLYLLPFLSVHDGHGLRVILLVAAFGLSQYFRQVALQKSLKSVP